MIAEKDRTFSCTKMSDLHRVPGEFRYENMVFSNVTSPEHLDRVKAFQFRDTDLLVAGYIKSGTSWTRYLLALINNDGQEVPGNWTVFGNAPALEIPDVFADGEAQQPGDTLESLPSPRVLGTHVPPRFLEKQVREGKVKVIVVIRNPKDTLVSLFHFYRMASGLGNFKGNWDQFFEMFRENLLWAGNVIEHHAEWWRLRHLPNVLIVRYEDMKKDLCAVIRQLAEFCGKDIFEVDAIAKVSTFDKLKNNSAINCTSFDKDGHFDFTVSKFMRKGQVGDWKNYFSTSQSDYVDKLCEQLTAPTGLYYDFE